MVRHLNPTELKENTFSLIGDEWMLITAGDQKECNTMTASYGGFGILFGKPVAHSYVRPERYTYQFLEDHTHFSLCFFEREYREKMQYCGRISGRDENKIEKCNFNTLFATSGTPYFEEAKITIICKKIYVQDLDKSLLLDKKLKSAVYGSGGVHRMYVGEIVDVFYNE